MSDAGDDDLFADLYGDDETVKPEPTHESPTLPDNSAVADPEPVADAPTGKAEDTFNYPNASTSEPPPRTVSPPTLAYGQSAPIKPERSASFDYDRKPDFRYGRDNREGNGGAVGIKEDGKMFIGGLNWETTDENLRDYFSQFGEVYDCNVMRDGATGRSRGFGFLTFKDPKTVNTVMVKEHRLDHKIIDPKRAIPRDEQEKTAKIFVGGVSQDATEQLFTEFFAQFGRVIDSTLMMDKDTGRPRGFGFVTFEGEGAVEACLAQPLEILGKPIEVKRAQPRGNMRDEDEMPGKFNRGGGGWRNNDRRGRGNEGQMQYQQQQQQNDPGQGQGMPTNNMTPAMAAQMMAYMQKLSQTMQMNQMMSGNNNPAMMQQAMAMQQQQMRGQGGPGGQQAMPPHMMNPQMMQQMQQMQMQQQQQMQGQGQGQGHMGPMGGNGHQPQFNPHEQMAFEQQKYEHQSSHRAGSVSSNGAHGTPAASWDGMYEDSPQPGSRGRGGSGHQGRNTPHIQAPINAPTGPKNAGRPGANYRGGGGGRGAHRGGFHPYMRNNG